MPNVNNMNKINHNLLKKGSKSVSVLADTPVDRGTGAAQGSGVHQPQGDVRGGLHGIIYI